MNGVFCYYFRETKLHLLHLDLKFYLFCLQHKYFNIVECQFIRLDLSFKNKAIFII